MSHHGLRLLVLFVAMTASPVNARQSQVTDRRDIAPDVATTVKIPKDAMLELKGVNADIDIVRAQGEDTVISIERTAAAAEPRVEMLTHEKGVTLCTVYASPNPKKPNECVPGTKGRLTEGVKKTSPGVRFKIELADGVHIRGDVVSGSFTAKAGQSNLDLKTIVGNISIDDNGSRIIEASTGARGDIVASIAPIAQPGGRSVRLDVVMGELRVIVPPKALIYYAIRTERTITTPFKITEPFAGVRKGTVNPAGGTPVLNLTLNASMLLGRFILQPATK